MELPVIPAIILVLVNAISPYFIDLLTSLNVTSNVKKTIAVVSSVVVTLATIVVALLVRAIPADFTPMGWVTLFLLGVGVQQFVFGVFYKNSPLAEAAKTQGVQ